MTIFYLPQQVAVTSSGIPRAFSKLYFYKAGTTTDQTVYKNADLAPGHAHAQPVVADATGTFPVIYLDPNAAVDYRVQLKSVLGALIYDQDNYPKSGVSGTTVLSTLFRYDLTAAESAASVTPVNFFYPEGYVNRYGTNTSPGTTDMQAAIQNACSVCAQNGGTVYFLPETYAISTGVTVSSKIKMIMAPGSLMKALGSFPNPGSIDSGTWMINASNANVSGSVFENINLHGNAIALGLIVGLADHCIVDGGYFTTLRGPAVFLDRCDNTVVRNVVTNLCGVDPALSGSAYTTSIRAEGVFGDYNQNNMFESCTVNSSGGKSFAMAYCNNGRMLDCFAKGWTASYGAGFYTSTCTNVRIIGGSAIMDAGSSATVVVKFSNDSDQCSIEDSYLETNVDTDIIHVQNVIGNTIRGCKFRKTVATSTSRQHIKINDDGVDTASQYLTIMGNEFLGHGNTNTICISTPSTVANVTVICNKFKAFAQAIQVVGANCIVQSNAFEDCVVNDQMAGASTPRADYVQRLGVSTTSSQNAVGPGAGTLSVNLAASTMDRIRLIHVTGCGTKTGSAGNKTIAFRFGTTDFTFNAAANDTNSWWFDAWVANVSETSQKVWGIGYNASTVLAFVGTAAENTATTLTVGVRATPAAADTITMTSLQVVLLP